MLRAPAARGARKKGCYFWTPLYFISIFVPFYSISVTFQNKRWLQLKKAASKGLIYVMNPVRNIIIMALRPPEAGRNEPAKHGVFLIINLVLAC
jgi:drug/metabolite transporter superfamily protein YnfA